MIPFDPTALLPKMISQGSGHIVAIGSVQGRIAIPHRTACKLFNTFFLLNNYVISNK